MSKYISQLNETEMKKFATFAGYELTKANFHTNCVAFALKGETFYGEISFVAYDFNLKARNTFSTSESYEEELQTAWRKFLRKKFKKEYKNDFYAWLDEQKEAIKKL